MSARLIRAARRVVEEWQANNSVSHDTLRELAAVMPRKRGDRGRPGPERRAKRKARRDRMAEIRRTVMERAQGHCEVCATGIASEAHHVLSGPLRRVRESVDTVLALCVDCHRGIHRGDVDALESARLYAESCGMHEAVAALAKRIDKIHEARASRPERETA